MCSLKITDTAIAAQKFYGHGKLLLTGEYFVLDGAKALAVPTRFGQSLRVQTLRSSSSTLYWVALNSKAKPWLDIVFDTSNFSFTLVSSTGESKASAQRLASILKAAQNLNPLFLSDDKDRAVETRLEFPNEWGMGSSSTLIHCISKWAGVDGYELLKNTLGGSGYDIACAACDSPILYRLSGGKPAITSVSWNPPFNEHIYFAYLGNKQLSSNGIAHYKSAVNDKSSVITQLDQITDALIKTNSFDEFEELITEHENILSKALKLEKIADSVFAGYPLGAVKSLGAWGGDFVMLTNRSSATALKEYMSEKNISIVFSWKNLILANNR